MTVVEDRDVARLILDRRTCCRFFIARSLPMPVIKATRRASGCQHGRWVFEIVNGNELHKFVLLRRIVERTLTWINRNRLLGRDFENTRAPSPASSGSRLRMAKDGKLSVIATSLAMRDASFKQGTGPAAAQAFFIALAYYLLLTGLD